MRTHPMVLIGGVLQENPFFVPPDQMLAELRGRKQRAEASGLAGSESSRFGIRS